MKDRISENDIVYKLVGDYYVWVLALPDEERTIAMQDKTYKKCEDKFVADWEIIDLRE